MNTVLRKIMAWGSMLGAFAIIYFFTFPHYRQGESSVAGKTAENFQLALDGRFGPPLGNPTHLSDLHGKVVVLNFWASWCPPCIEETPALIQLQQRIASRNGVVLGVSIDDDEAAYDKFIREKGVNFPTYRDPSKQIATDYGTSMWPETYVIDRKGKILRKIIGPQDWNSPEMTAYFDAILGQS
jgi:cytochrome c biogenesis protein CcmG/thiol:disulfide interchange protein DsbE